MPTTTHTEQLFRGLQQFRDKPHLPSGYGAWTADAVIATLVYATEMYLKNEVIEFVFRYSIGNSSLREPSLMEMIRRELEELFGLRNVWVHSDHANTDGIQIYIKF